MHSAPKNESSERDPEQLERAADRLRADLDRTLDALERKVSPSQLLDRSLAYLRDHGGELANAVGDSVRRHPVPILLTIAGLGWLIVSAVRAREPVAQYRDRTVSAIEERPLLFSGLAVAIGALLGAVIPSTPYEDKVVGQLRDRAVERAKQMGERKYQNLRSQFETHQDVEVSGQAH